MLILFASFFALDSVHSQELKDQKTGDEPLKLELKESKDWEFSMAPYLWLMGMNGDIEAGDQAAEVDVSFADLFENLDFALQLYAEAARPGWGVFVDVIYADLGADGDRRGIDIDVDMKTVFVEAAIFKRFEIGQAQNKRLDLFVGGRWTYLEAELDVESFLFGINYESSMDNDWVDLMVGARLGVELNEKWSLGFRTDFAGFGIGSGSELTWSASVLAGRAVGQNSTLYFGYRHRNIDYESGSGRNTLEADIAITGPIIGMSRKF
jgi:hypothetical protein